MFATLDTDALFEVDRPAAAGIKRWIASGDALHALCRIIVAVRTGAVGGARLAVPQRLAVEHRQHAGIGSIVVLHRLGLAAHVGVGGPTILRCNFSSKGRAKRQCEKMRYAHDASQSVACGAPFVSPLSCGQNDCKWRPLPARHRREHGLLRNRSIPKSLEMIG